MNPISALSARNAAGAAPPGDGLPCTSGSPRSTLRDKLDEIAGALVASRPDCLKISADVLALREQVGREEDDAARMSSLCQFLQQHVEHEKAALSRELHDALGGILTPAKMDLAWLMARLGKDPEFAARMDRLDTLIDQGIDLKRRIIERLRPSLLDHLGLASALQWHVEETCRDAGLECRLAISDQLERLSPDFEIALYRLVQEGVANVVSHAQARCLDLAIERDARGLNLVIADDGVGIADIEHAKGQSHGLAGMMHRVRCLDGTLDIDSHPGEGTRIRIFVPLA